MIPDLCKIEIDRRLLPGETPEYRAEQIKEAIDRAKARDPTIDASVKVLEKWPPMEVTPEEPVVKSLVRCSRG